MGKIVVVRFYFFVGYITEGEHCALFLSGRFTPVLLYSKQGKILNFQQFSFLSS